MKEEKLIDAMALLPEEMLEETDRLRQKKKIPLKAIGALAACLCLAAGLSFLALGNKSAESAILDHIGNSYDCSSKAESASGTDPQFGSVLGHKFCGREYVDVTVTAVYEGRIRVVESNSDAPTADGQGDLISTAFLEPPQAFTVGQQLRIYFAEKLEAYMDPDTRCPVLLPKNIEALEQEE